MDADNSRSSAGTINPRVTFFVCVPEIPDEKKDEKKKEKKGVVVKKTLTSSLL